MSDLQRLYDEDFTAWTERSAELLRRRRFAELDIDHLIEELEGMGKGQRHELVNRLRVLLAHLLKWQFQYRQLSERWAEFEGKSWRNTIIEQRAAIRYLLDKNPGLQSTLADAVAEAHPQAVELAAAETGLAVTRFPPECDYAWEEILDRDFYPAPE